MAQRALEDAETVWRRYDEMEARLSAPLSERMIDLAAVGPGSRVLDLATGRGEPAVRAALRAGPTGHVLGVDAAAPMLAMAAERAAREGAALELRAGDAADPTTLADLPPRSFDAVLCRWGLMYMAAPVATLAAARRALRPGGALCIAVFAGPEHAPFFELPRRALRPRAAAPPPPELADATASGTFRYADGERLRQDLRQAGLRLVHEEELDVPVMEARSGQELVDWAWAFGMGRILLELPEEIEGTWAAEFARAGEAYRQADGWIRLGGRTRVALAR